MSGMAEKQAEAQRLMLARQLEMQQQMRERMVATQVAMARDMLFIANLGVDFLRMDAVAFVWKRKGTPCENLPEAHHLLRAWL